MKAFIVSIVLVFLAACGGGPESGVVYGKTIVPPGFYWIPITNSVNGVTTISWIWVFYPEQPKLYICPRKDEGDKCGWVNVDHSEYEEFNMKDWYEK